MDMAHYHLGAYIVLAIIFASVLTYMVMYNLRLKRLQKGLEGSGRHMGTEEGISAATEADLHEHRAHRHHL
jgi:hypothetical protein